MGIVEDFRMLRAGRDWRGRAATPRSAEPWVARREPRGFPTGWARTGPARAARSILQHGVLRPLVWAETRPQVHGLDLVGDLDGPVVFVVNHASHLDAPLVLCSLPRRLSRNLAVGAAADYFFDARWRASLTALVFNAFPVERQSTRRARSIAPDLLDLGWSLLLFPEGTRSNDGWVGSFRFGPAQLCLSHGIPAVPVAIRGAYAAMPRGRNWPRPGRPPVSVRYGRPVWPVEDETLREFNLRLEHAIARLWNEQSVGWWTALREHAADVASGRRSPLPKGPEAARWRRIWESTRPLPGQSPRSRVWNR